MTPLNSLIRPQPWINWLVVAFGLVLWAGVLRLGWTVDHSDSGLKEVIGLRAGRLTRLFAATCLLGVTQLSLVTLWYRTHSRKDFQGQYRVWIWSSLTWGLLFGSAITGWHISWSSSLAAQLPHRLQPLAEMAWLPVAAILAGTACRLLSREMACSTATRWLLNSATLVGTLTVLLEVATGFFPHSVVRLLCNATGALWPLLMASALLHHARYVIHVSNEATPWAVRASRLSPVVRQVWAEVLLLGPSRATLARSLSPQKLWQMTLRGARSCRALSRTAWSLIARRLSSRRKETQEAGATSRRKAAPSLPVVASSNESPGKSAQKSATKALKSA
ncbi:hypothetical protein [Caulifigura coniformis]|uniref:hypothetical protein n=1 Tax=Caulifigura coniformis TaxID=2527983 RepID=UPI0011A598DB|nr:hypothetical protein [Caulifigura coniformis]